MVVTMTKLYNIRCINSMTGKEIFDKEINEKELDSIRNLLKTSNDEEIINLELPDKIKDYLKYLEKNGYGSNSEIINSSGLIPLIIEIYSRAREEEIREKNNQS